MINEKQAWTNFTKTGKVEDYIKYTQARNMAGVEISPDRTVELPSAFPLEVRYAGQNRGTDNKGTDYRGERPSCNGADPR